MKGKRGEKKERNTAQNIQTKWARYCSSYQKRKKKKPPAHTAQTGTWTLLHHFFFYPTKQPRLRVHISARVNSSFGERIQADLEPFHNLVQHLSVLL